MLGCCCHRSSNLRIPENSASSARILALDDKISSSSLILFPKQFTRLRRTVKVSGKTVLPQWLSSDAEKERLL